MTLPASGTISVNQLNTETAVASTTTKSLTWLNGNTKSWSGVYSMDQIYSFAYYQKNNAAQNCTANMAGACNCNVTNCNSVCCQVQTQKNGIQNYNCNCSAIGACSNCNCDNRAWLQPNCNCGYSNCAYNCNCACSVPDCNCNCDCGG
jgi:hypothetical protein